ncbi:MAG TPA: FAD-binding protein [Myxococcales bacterium]|jgi:3-oxo-5alpha-steroid 4-dehydrogenase
MKDAYDVVVVGFGAAGACAAIEAARAGARVLVLERYAGGGATKLSGGVVYAGGGTGPQKAAGVEDDVESMVRYLARETDGGVEEGVLRAFCESSRENLAWLESLGLAVPPKLFPDKTTQPPDGYGLYFSGNEQPYEGSARPAARGHVPGGKGMTGAEIFEALRKAALAAGVEVRTHAKVERLVADGEDGIRGVEISDLTGTAAAGAHGLLGRLGMIGGPIPALGRSLEKRGKRSIVSAKTAVLAAGGFVFNAGMMKRYAPAYAGCMPLGTPGDDGSGIELGQAVGAGVEGMDRCAASRFLCPPEAFVSGLLVNLDGERFCDETLYGATLSAHIAAQPKARAWLVVDARQHDLADLQLDQEENVSEQPLAEIFAGRRNALIFRKLTGSGNLHLNRKRAGSLRELAEKMGVPAGALEKTVVAYNAVATGGTARDAFGKRAAYVAALQEAPFFAVDCRLDSKLFPSPCLTLGGLRTDALTAQVLDESGGAIRGLFAAGRNAAGVCSRSYVSGLSIADCVFSGRNAGRSAARAAKS